MGLSWGLIFLSFILGHVLLAKAVEEAVVDPDGTVTTPECVDLNERCPNMILRSPYCTGLAEAKELDEDYLYKYCPKSCKACGLSGEELEEFKKKQRLLASVGGDERLLETTYGYKQKLVSGKRKEIKDIIAKMEEYMTKVVMVEPKYERVRATCKLRHDSCAYWKAMGQCEEKKLKRFMRQNCAPVCEICEELDFFHRCPVDESVPYAIQKGELNSLFEKILTDPEFQKYEPRALRKPDDDQPYILVLDSFLSEEEADMLIQLGQDIGYKQSVDTGPARNDGSHGNLVTTWRTSHTAWCGTESCLNHDVPIAIANRVQNLTGIPIENAEHLQILKYEMDQFYNYHHDCTPHHKERQMGPRVLTFFLYLNTVEEGGGTQFPNADNLTIQPKKGRAVLWPNVLDEDPSQMDKRTAHQANPVKAGSKYAANYWIHQRNWKETYKRGCI